jgi:hypothetical protein
MRHGKATQSGEQWHVCSDLVSVHWRSSRKKERIEAAVLEEISAEGAVIQLESAIASQTAIRLNCPAIEFDGIVRESWREEELGYFAEIAFNAGQRWSIDVYRPRHLLEPGDIRQQAPECMKGRGNLDRCPTEYVARAVNPQIAMDETVRRVAQNIAVVCGEMTTVELARCFVDFFGAPKKCLLFTAFAEAYRSARANLVGPYEQPVSPLCQACNVAMLLASIPDEAHRAHAPAHY